MDAEGAATQASATAQTREITDVVGNLDVRREECVRIRSAAPILANLCFISPIIAQKPRMDARKIIRSDRADHNPFAFC